MNKLDNGIGFRTDRFEVRLQYWWNAEQFTPIEWTIEKGSGWLYTTATLLGVQLYIGICYDKVKSDKFSAKLEQSRQEYEAGDYYFFVHNKNKKLKEFAEYMDEHEGLRFWQGLSAWTGKDITVGGEDPFYWDDNR